MPTLLFVIAGVLLIGVALTGTVLKRLPLTSSMFYLAIGAARQWRFAPGSTPRGLFEVTPRFQVECPAH